MFKPVFVLLHGAWHTPQCWDSLVKELAKAGYDSIAPALPSSGSTPPVPDWSADIQIIRKTVSELVEKGRDVAVVMHSFSGMTGGTALEGLDRESRAASDLPGGVIRLIYVVAFLVPEGFQHSPHGTRDNMVPEMKADFEVSRVVKSHSPSLADFAGRHNHDTTRRCQTHVLSGPGRCSFGRFSERIAASESRRFLEHNHSRCMARNSYHVYLVHRRCPNDRSSSSVPCRFCKSEWPTPD
jgi:pimeloyl-ACP methyl ester carboxylesterase